MVKLYTEKDLGAIVAGEWEVVGGLGARADSGIGVIATRRELKCPVWKHTHDIALPFPFTLEQFRTFCAWHPTFEWEAVESQFTNDDGSMDEAALTELSGRGINAADLVRRFLIGESDDAPAAASDKTVRPMQRSTAQDAAVMSAIREAGCDPLKLPKPPQGKSGIKAVVRAALVGKNPLFPKGGTQFVKAWDRLRTRDEIADLG